MWFHHILISTKDNPAGCAAITVTYKRLEHFYLKVQCIETLMNVNQYLYHSLKRQAFVLNIVHSNLPSTLHSSTS